MTLTPENWFRLGAEAMVAEAAARLVVAGQMELAKVLIAMPMPKFQVPLELPSMSPGSEASP